MYLNELGLHQNAPSLPANTEDTLTGLVGPNKTSDPRAVLLVLPSTESWVKICLCKSSFLFP